MVSTMAMASHAFIIPSKSQTLHECFYNDKVIAVCWLHDVIEDSDFSEADMRQQFGDIITDAVVAVTYTDVDKHTGIDKINKARTNPIGHIAKYCDASCNLANVIMTGPKRGRDAMSRLDHYHDYVRRLEPGMPVPDDL